MNTHRETVNAWDTELHTPRCTVSVEHKIKCRLAECRQHTTIAFRDGTVNSRIQELGPPVRTAISKYFRMKKLICKLVGKEARQAPAGLLVHTVKFRRLLMLSDKHCAFSGLEADTG